MIYSADATNVLKENKDVEFFPMGVLVVIMDQSVHTRSAYDLTISSFLETMKNMIISCPGISTQTLTGGLTPKYLTYSAFNSLN